MFTPLFSITHGPLTAKIPAEPPRWVIKILSSKAEQDAKANPDMPMTNALSAEEMFVSAGIVRLTSSDPEHELEWPKLNPLGDPGEIDEILEQRRAIVSMLPQSFFKEIARELESRGGLTSVEEGNSAAE